MTRCAAVACKNMGVHCFPKDPNRRKLWEETLRRKNWKSTKWSKLCADHFKPEDYYGKNSYTGDEPVHKFLKKSAVPSIFSFTTIKPAGSQAQQQGNPLEDRCKKKLKIEIDGFPISWPSGIQNQNKCTDEMIVGIEVEIPDIEVDDIEEVTQPQILKESKSTQVNFDIYGSIQRYKNKDNVIAFYTGFKTYEKFYFVFSTLSPMSHLIKYYGSPVQNISVEDQFFMTMMKLRQNKCNLELALFFETSPTTVHNVFITWVNYMYQLWNKLNVFSSKDLVKEYMPDSLKKLYENTPLIIDLNLENNVSLEIPTFLKGQEQMPGLKLSDRSLEQQRVHIEHLIGLTKTYKILKDDLDHNFVPLAYKIFFVCLMCCHFRECSM